MMQDTTEGYFGRVPTAWELFRTVLIVQFDSGGQWNTRAIGKEVEHNHTCRRGVV